METLDIMRAVSGLAWLAVLLVLSGSLVRGFTGRERHLDRSWSLCWMFAALQIGWAWRAYHGLAVTPGPGFDYSSALGLNVLSAMVAALVLFRRWTYGERRL